MAASRPQLGLVRLPGRSDRRSGSGAAGYIGSGLESFDGGDPVDGLIERSDSAHSGGLGGRNQVRLGEVQSVDLGDLDRALL